MSIIKEYVNHVNKDIPYIVRDDLINQMTVGKYPKKTLNVNGKEITFEAYWMDFPLNSVERLSNYYYSGEQDKINIEFAIKSKNSNDFNYVIFYNKISQKTLTAGIEIVKELNTDISKNNKAHYSITELFTSDKGNSSFAILDVGEYIGLARFFNSINAYNENLGIITRYHFVEKKAIEEMLGKVYTKTYDTEYGGISDADGYDPNFDNSSDIITIPNTPSIGVSNVGFVNVYKPTQGALQNLGSDLFPDFEEVPDVTQDTDTLTMLANGFEYLGKNITTFLKSYINSNLVNYIIDCHCLPVTPTVGNTEQIKIGFKEFTQSAPRVTSDYVDFDCGSLNIKEYYGNFIDYVGTRASLYLPFVGFVPIKNEYFQSGELNVKYRFNVVDGSFMCYVIATSSKSNLKNSVIGTYSGNACVHIPITGLNYSNMVSGVVNGAMGVGMSVATGNVGMAVGGALNMMSMKPQMQSSNSYNATSSFLGIRYPYILIEREVSNFSEKYPNEYGLPLNVTKTISELSGYIQMDDNIHININCMDEEKTMITDLLTGGIII